jgi:hypothetical protein
VAYPADGLKRDRRALRHTASSYLLAGFTSQNLRNQFEVKTQIELVSKDTSPFIFTARIRSASFPEKPLQLLVELAEGIEPPTL